MKNIPNYPVIFVAVLAAIGLLLWFIVARKREKEKIKLQALLLQQQQEREKKEEEKRLQQNQEKEVVQLRVPSDEDAILILKHPIKACIRIIVLKNTDIPVLPEHLVQWLKSYLIAYRYSNRTEKALGTTLEEDYLKLFDCVDQYIETSDEMHIYQIEEIVSTYPFIDIDTIKSGYTKESFCDRYDVKIELLESYIEENKFLKKLDPLVAEGRETEIPFVPVTSWREALNLISVESYA